MEPLVQAEPARRKAAHPQRVGRPKLTVVTGSLIVDDSVPPTPQGRKLGGLGKHYSSTEQQGVTGHGLCTALDVLLGRRCPLQARMYRQQAMCQQEGVPFLSKIDRAVDAIEHFEPVPGTPTHVLVDRW
jgi:hypothetical protein